MELLDYIIILFLILRGIFLPFFIMAAPFCIPQNSAQKFQFLTSSSILLISYAFDRCEVISHVLLICISLMISDVEHLLIYLLAICITSLEKLYYSSHLDYLVLCCWVVRVPYIFWIITLIRYMTCKYFLPFCRLAFHSIDSFLWCAEAFKFSSSSFLVYVIPLIYFCFCCLCFWCHIQKNHCQD